MANNLTKEIATKAAMLPDDLQSEALQFVESLLARQSNTRGNKQPFASVKGILQGNYDTLEGDISEMRHDLLKRMQTAKAKKGMKKAFNASPVALGRAAVKAGRKKQ